MNGISEAKGSIATIIRNDDKLYGGNLVHYFRIIFNHAQNLQNPYHNFRHIFHVLWLCYQACFYYRGHFSPELIRDLLIAAMFHDMDHSGMAGNDDLNIERAVRGIQKHILPEDEKNLSRIISLIRITEYPYKVPTEELTLYAQILRDADMAQALNVAWIQQVVFGLAEEWRKSPKEVLEAQINFHGNLKFHTEWAKERFPQTEIDAKIAEAKELLEFLR